MAFSTVIFSICTTTLYFNFFDCFCANISRWTYLACRYIRNVHHFYIYTLREMVIFDFIHNKKIVYPHPHTYGLKMKMVPGITLAE